MIVDRMLPVQTSIQTMLSLQESQIAELKQQIQELQNGGIEDWEQVPPELEKLQTENQKLKYRISHLKRVGLYSSIHFHQRQEFLFTPTV